MAQSTERSLRQEVVRRTLAGKGPYDTGLFHCHQVVEKYLKALLAVHKE